MGMRGWLTPRIRNEAWRPLTFDGGEGLDESRKERKHIMEEGKRRGDGRVGISMNSQSDCVPP